MLEIDLFITSTLVIVTFYRAVKISAVLDPSVRDIVMSKQESSNLLEETYINLYESLYGKRILSLLNDDVNTQVLTVQSMTPQKSDNSCVPPMVNKMKLAFIQEATDAIHLETVIESPVRVKIALQYKMKTFAAVKFVDTNKAEAIPLLWLK